MSGNCTDHKIAHNITTLANIPLVAWLVISLFCLAGASYEEFSAWIAHPVNIVASIFFVIVTLRHFTLELEVVFEDYISRIWLRNLITYGLKTFWAVLAVSSIVSILKIAL